MNKKIVLITGTSTGIGYATAKKFLEEGHIVYGIARRTKLMQPLVKKGGYMVTGDVRKDEDVETLVQKIIKEQGKIDILINNAGYAQYGPLEDVSIELAKSQFDTNVFSYARTIKAVMPQMRKQKSGMIINVTSSAGKINGPLVTWYGASKFALEGLLDALRNETNKFGIKTVIIEPGFIKTDLYRVAWEFLDKVKISEVYKKMIAGFKEGFVKRGKNAPKGEIIANAIYKASISKNPKTRYVLPKDAKLFLFMRKILSDKAFDKLIRKASRVE